MGFKTARHAFSDRKAVSQQGTGRKLRPDSILLIWAAAMAGDGQGSQTGGQDGRTEQSLQSFVQSLDPSQMAILRQMLENSQDRGKG